MKYDVKADLEKAAKFAEDARSIVDNAKSENRDMNTDEETQFDTLMGEHQSAENNANRKAKLNGVFDAQGEKQEELADKLGRSKGEQDNFEKDSRSAFESYVRNGLMGMSQNERDIMKRAQTVGTNSEGGYTVDSMLADQIETFMVNYGGMREVCNVISTSTGGDLSFVTNNDTGNTGELLAESATAANQDTAFGIVTLNAYKYSSKAMYITRELLQDSNYDIVGHIAQLAAERIGRITNTHYTTGDGSGKPKGIVNSSTVGAVTASATAVTFNELLELKHSVDRDYRFNATWMFNDQTLLALKKVALASANQSLWQAGIVGGAPATIDGQAYTVNNDLPDMAADSHSIIYGDMKKYTIRDVAGFELLRSDELNMLKGQSTFVGFMRSDADQINSAAIKHLRQIGT